MNKFLIALTLTLAVASAQDMCQFSIFAVLPSLQPLYTNYAKKDWVAVEKNVENLIPASQMIVQNCMGYTLFQSDNSQKCLKSVYGLARMFAPLANQANSSDALVHLVNNFKDFSREFYITCFLNNVYGETQEELALFDTSDLAEFVYDGIFDCIQSVSSITPALMTFYNDVKAKAGFEAIDADLKAVFAQVDPLCDNCGLPRPSGKSGPVDIAKCLQAADTLADDAHNIITGGLDISKIISGVTSLLEHLSPAISECGLD